MADQNRPDICKIVRAAQPLPLVVDSPHSGRIYPADFGYACPMAELVRAEDNRVDELIGGAPAHGASLLCALFPRTYIDVNRHETDIDPLLLDAPWPGERQDSRLSQIGYGLIRRLVRPGLPVYDRALTAGEVQQRIDDYYTPYHDALGGLINDALYRFGEAWHLNMHAMPSHGGIGRKNGKTVCVAQADFVLGDRDGTSCDRAFTMMVRDTLIAMGYNVAINHPYKGVEIVRRYGKPQQGRHSLQVEINKALYWDEIKNRPTANFAALKTDIDALLKKTAQHVHDGLRRIAAD